MALLLLAPLAAQAQVKATLVAADSSVQPGKSVTVALRLEHEPHWHTYWINAGTGYATSLQWELPPGTTGRRSIEIRTIRPYGSSMATL